MTQPLGSYRRSNYAPGPPTLDPDAPPTQPAPGAPAGPRRMLEDGSPPLVREDRRGIDSVALALAPDGEPRLTTAGLREAEAEAVRARVRDAAIMRGLDAFLAAMTPTYHTPEGDIQVATPFAMSPLYENQRKALEQTGAHLDPALLRAGLNHWTRAQVAEARGTPEQIQRLTQALIDGGHLSTDTSIRLCDRVRQMMFDHGIGIDCAGYVQQAYLESSGVTRASARFKEAGSEDLSGLRARGYGRIRNVGDVRPGDMGVLNSLDASPRAPGEPPPPGHRVIVYERHWATAREIEKLLQGGMVSSSFVTDGPILVLTVDSSWGAADASGQGSAAVGGVRRDTWWYNEDTTMWGWLEEARFASGSRVYRHSLEGFYRSQSPLPTSTRAPTATRAP